jgi:integration host factor subunit beta
MLVPVAGLTVGSPPPGRIAPAQVHLYQSASVPACTLGGSIQRDQKWNGSSAFWREDEGATSMIKSELVHRIASANTHLYGREVENVVNAILGEIMNAMARDDRVELRGFGAFSTKIRQARMGRNPRTGAIVPVGQKALPFFKSAKEMYRRLNPDKSDARTPANPPSTSK